MLHPKQRKQPRYHEGLDWEEKNLTNDFIDITRMALDDRYAKNAAPLSKRRNGVGPTQGYIPGLFGGHDINQEFVEDVAKETAFVVGVKMAAKAFVVLVAANLIK